MKKLTVALAYTLSILSLLVSTWAITGRPDTLEQFLAFSFPLAFNDGGIMVMTLALLMGVLALIFSLILLRNKRGKVALFLSMIDILIAVTLMGKTGLGAAVKMFT